jgi:hypothetical protein
MPSRSYMNGRDLKRSPLGVWRLLALRPKKIDPYRCLLSLVQIFLRRISKFLFADFFQFLSLNQSFFSFQSYEPGGFHGRISKF